MSAIRNWLENLFVHTGSAVWGSECCDNSPRMYWLARLVKATIGECEFDDDLEYLNTKSKYQFLVGQWLMDVGCRIATSDSEPVPVVDYDDENLCALCGRAEPCNDCKGAA